MSYFFQRLRPCRPPQDSSCCFWLIRWDREEWAHPTNPKQIISLVISGISRLNPLRAGVRTYLGFVGWTTKHFYPENPWAFWYSYTIVWRRFFFKHISWKFLKDVSFISGWFITYTIYTPYLLVNVTLAQDAGNIGGSSLDERNNIISMARERRCSPGL